MPIQIGGQIWYCESPDKIASNLIEARPTVMTAVPRLYEVLYERITRRIQAKGGLSSYLMNKTIALGRKRLLAERGAGARLNLLEILADHILSLLVRRKVRAQMGGRLKFFVSGGAALNPDIGTFFLALGVNILQGYGQTEASPLISANRPDQIRIETVGKAVAGIEVRVAEDGELLVRGDAVMKGYWRNKAATAETIRKGWLHTGDLAEMSRDGFITIIGRKKDMIVNSGGENIAPAHVEGEMLLEPEIAQIMVSGDRRPYLVAVIVAAEDADIDAVRHAVKKANIRLASHEQVRHFILADSPFSVENEQMTPTLKVRRHIVSEVYKDRLDSLYRR